MTNWSKMYWIKIKFHEQGKNAIKKVEYYQIKNIKQIKNIIITNCNPTQK